jgi:hypothetical protein
MQGKQYAQEDRARNVTVQEMAETNKRLLYGMFTDEDA